MERCLNDDALVPYQQATTAFASGDFERALHAFEDAFSADADPRLRWNIAASLLKLGDLVRAATELDVLLATENTLSVTEARLAKKPCKISPHVSTFRPDVTPQGTSVVVDGTPRGLSPLALPIRLDRTRKHIFRFEKPGFHPVVFEVGVGKACLEKSTCCPTRPCQRIQRLA